jgi:hypothetical protein
VTAYCMKHKGTIEISAPREVVLKNGRKAIQGVCPQDGTKVTRILGLAK